jgi:protein SCO1/2
MRDEGGKYSVGRYTWPMSMRHARGFASRSTLLVIVAAFAAGLGLYAAQRWFPSGSHVAGSTPAAGTPATGPDHSTRAPVPGLKAVRLIEPPRRVGAFTLPLADGTQATPASLAGHWTVVFLGFTHCPDVCPTTLAELAKAQAQWRSLPEATRPRLLFVSVDPDRDSPRGVGEYTRFFAPDTLAAAPREAQLAPFAQALGLVYMKVPGANGDYEMDHSATLVVLDAQGREAGLIRPPLAWADIAADLAALAKARP